MSPVSGFVQRLNRQLLLDGEPYRIAGANNYYVGYVSEPTLDAVLAQAQSFGMNAMRIWAFLDSARPPGPGEVCFQYWDPAATAPVVNGGPDGLERLDRAIASAGDLNIRLILTLTNNWKDFGGMPRYVEWLGLRPDQKNLFYTDARCRRAYRNWTEQIVTRRNTITGRLYRDEPAILAWELANEPRCEVPGGVDILLGWVEEMSGFIHGLDANHLIAVGDEGLFQRGRAGGDLLGIDAIDFGTAHLYPQTMAPKPDPIDFGLTWIGEHLAAGERANKPMLIEEYGLRAPNAERNAVFGAWFERIEALGGVGDMLWMLGLPKGGDQPYDPDGYVIGLPEDAPAIAAHVRRILS